MDKTTTVLQKIEAKPNQATISPEIAIKRYCGTCLSAYHINVCTGTGCPLFPVSPYKCEGLPVVNSATVTGKALVNKGPHTALSGRV